MQRCLQRGIVLAWLGMLSVTVTVTWAQPKVKLERLKVAIAPLGWDTHPYIEERVKALGRLST